MKRPWYISGNGELLGLLLCRTADGCGDLAAQPHVTQWGQDSTWSSAGLPDFPQPEDFRNRVEFKDLEHTISEKEVTPEGASGSCRLVAFQPVEVDAQRLRCDIEMSSHRAYYPFVRFALVRFQPCSEEGCHVSTVVRTDFMQLTPDRFALIEYSENEKVINLTIRGVSYSSRRMAKDVAGKGPSGMSIRLWERYRDIPGDLGWHEVANADVRLVSVGIDDGSYVWRFEVHLPESRKRANYRISIVEDEEREIDFPGDTTKRKTKKRTVYADVLGV
jgi:hypothetical protein